MAAALERVAGKAATALLDRTPDPAIQRIVKTWPGRFEARRAGSAGLVARHQLRGRDSRIRP